MKYGQYWKDQFNHVPSCYQRYVINYKTYKKIIKNNASGFLEKLSNDAKAADACFIRIKGNNEDMLRFAILNATSLYKICKKAHKKYPEVDAMAWLQSVQNRHMFQFVGGIKKTLLALEENVCAQKECPICLDEYNKNLIIMHCGHFICLGCAKHMLHVSKLKGTIYNLIAHGTYKRDNSRCPLCRDKVAFRKFEYVP